MSSVVSTIRTVNSYINWSRVFSVRVWMLSIFVGIIPGCIIASYIPALFFLTWVGAVITFVLQVLNPNPTTCPECAKRIKLDAVRCHHCGYRIVRQG